MEHEQDPRVPALQLLLAEASNEAAIKLLQEAFPHLKVMTTTQHSSMTYEFYEALNKVTSAKGHLDNLYGGFPT